jgi:prevent-host-death family protein
MVYSLAAARARLGELVAEVQHSRRPVMIGDAGKPAAALISVEELADLEDRAAPAEYQADKAAGRSRGVLLENLDDALDQLEAPI